jgi:hypothetical protein
VLAALFVASPVPATTRAPSSSAGAATTRAWCALVIQINTKYGTMKNKRYLPVSKVPLSAWRGVIDAALAGRNHILSVTPASIKKAMTHELVYFAHVKANRYSLATAPAPYTAADARQLGEFQRTKCGITFAGP